MELQTSLNPDYCYSIKELALAWNVSDETITRLFEEEPGVLIFKIQQTGKRPYRTIRIPGKVALRVQNRMMVVEP